jgi:hypothetical protein
MNAIDFKGTMIQVISDENGKRWVSVRHVCEALGIDHKNQRAKLQSSPEYQWGDITSVDRQGRNYPMFCISAEHAHLWVAGISAAKIRPDIRDSFIAYKHECANTLYNHFQSKGEDFLGIAQQLMGKMDSICSEIKHIRGATEAVFGDDRDEIQTLVQEVSALYQVDGRTVWGWVQSELDVQSYKRQNRKIINFLKNKLGKGLTLVKE